MRIRPIVGSLVAAVVFGGGVMAVNNNNPVASKTIKEVMKIAHDKKDGLLKKVQDGSATDYLFKANALARIIHGPFSIRCKNLLRRSL